MLHPIFLGAIVPSELMITVSTDGFGQQRSSFYIGITLITSDYICVFPLISAYAVNTIYAFLPIIQSG